VRCVSVRRLGLYFSVLDPTVRLESANVSLYCRPMLLAMLAMCQEEQMRGKAKWEHLNEDLHVLITVEDAKNRATIKLKHAVEQVKKLLIPSVSH